MISFIDRVVQIYFNEFDHHGKKLTRDEAIRYFTYMENKGRLITAMHSGKLVAYVESWRLNIDQLVRLMAGDKFIIYDEDITKGNICYVSDVWIDKDHRFTHMVLDLKQLLFEQNEGCEHFVGEEMRHRNRFKHYRRYGNG